MATSADGMDRGGTLVLDVGKSHAKLLLVDGCGSECWRDTTANHSEPVAARGEAPGYLGLGIARLGEWIDQALGRLGAILAEPGASGLVPRRLVVTTHGAAFVPLGDAGALLPPMDYEWDGFGEVTAGFDASLGNFAHHGTPRLPQGLNAGRQIDWLQRRRADDLRGLRHWLPYPQYWAWWFSGIAVSEVSSLGCHTGLWSPSRERFSDWAQASGTAAKFAPLRRAWEPVGPLRADLARRWQLPEDLQVLTGAHDSNACLARHLRTHPNALVLSTGTWTVAMAPGAPSHRLAPGMDELINVAVDGRSVPTARFMGGREFAALCAGADPALATAELLREVLADGWQALPSWSDSGGPFVGRRGQVLRKGEPASARPQAVPATLRPALAALYCARMSGLLIDELLPAGLASPPVILEGPFAHNEAFCVALAAQLRGRGALLRCTDGIEGTARGAWLLAHWDDANAVQALPALAPVRVPDDAVCAALDADARTWRAALSADASPARGGPGRLSSTGDSRT